MSFPVGSPGPRNAITDVAGVLAGHHQRIGEGWATGTTVVLVTDGAVGGVDGRGGAPGTRETDLLDPSNLVQRANAVCLSGGSAYGLAAADGVMRWLAERHLGYRVGLRPHEVVPIVPAAVLFDLPMNDWGNRPDAEFGYAACDAAMAAGPEAALAQGCVGAGVGAKLGSLKGGVGTASVVLDGGFTVGALVVANAAGEAVDPTSGLPWAAGLELAGEFELRSAGDHTRTRSDNTQPARLNTTIGVVATDAALSKAECRRLAISAQNGLARAVRPAHTMFDGDTFFALATGARELHAVDGPFGEASRAGELDQLCTATADVVARAIVHALLAAEGLGGVPAYRDRYPSAPA